MTNKITQVNVVIYLGTNLSLNKLQHWLEWFCWSFHLSIYLKILFDLYPLDPLSPGQGSYWIQKMQTYSLCKLFGVSSYLTLYIYIYIYLFCCSKYRIISSKLTMSSVNSIISSSFSIFWFTVVSKKGI